MHIKNLHRSLAKALEACADVPESIAENRIRLLKMARDIKHTGRTNENERVFHFAREVVELSGGIVNDETPEAVAAMGLTMEEYDLLPMAFRESLLLFLIDILSGREDAACAPGCVRSLTGLASVRFDQKREACLEQERMLLKDPVFVLSDEATRARYRKELGLLAKESGRPEQEVIARAGKNIGEVLFGEQKNAFRLSLGLGPVKQKAGLYTTGIMLGTVLLSAGWLFLPVKTTVKFLLMLFSLTPAFTLAERFFDRLILWGKQGEVPLRIKEEEADRPENKTAIVLTAMLPDEDACLRALASLEEYYAGNRLDHGVYVILGDLKGSRTETEPEDEKLLSFLQKGIRALNDRYENAFVCLIRKRTGQNGSFFGRERKRGALEDLVKLLAGENVPMACKENEEALAGTAYICTLDFDNVLPPGSVKRLLAVAVHPLNALKIRNGKPVAGYGLVQPQIRSGLQRHTGFLRLMASGGGMEPYNGAFPEVFPLLFGTGSFCGKGLFSVAAYRALVLDKIRPNTVLSHDLLEGELLRTLSAGDVTFMDEFPPEPISYYQRAERWIRGDWQLLPYLFSALPPASRWKMLANMLRSLAPVGAFLTVLAAPFCGVWAYGVWTAALMYFWSDAIGTTLRQWIAVREKYLWADTSRQRSNVRQKCLWQMCVLPFEAFLNGTAACKGVFRRLISRKNILQWNTFASTLSQKNKKAYYRFFLPGMAGGILFYAVCLLNGVGVLTGLIPAVVWMLLPHIAYRAAQKKDTEAPAPTGAEREAPAHLAVHTLRFFSDALRLNDGLMPDNLQTEPYRGYAMRTSPTNLGMALASPLCGAFLDLYGPGQCCAETLEQWQKIQALPHYKGHLYNWYDLHTKEPLSPYVSTVDSGNFCACAGVLGGGIGCLRDKPILGKAGRRGMALLLRAACDGATEDTALCYKELAARWEDADKLQTLALCDETLTLVKDDPFLSNILRCRAEDFRLLSFSPKLLDALREQDGTAYEEALRFPLTLRRTLEYENTAWMDASPLKKQIREEFKRIYAYAYGLEEKIAFLERETVAAIQKTDFLMLYRKDKKLLAIGMDTQNGSCGEACYDMLVSEARLTSLIAIAFGGVDPAHWFSLSRPFARVFDEPLCLSWSGTMFEYLMPDLFIRPTRNAMLAVSSHLAVRAQINEKGLWGVSESAYGSLDASGEYRYRAFGVQKTALATLQDEKVYAPYATLLALEYAPKACMNNIVRLVEGGALGPYGFFEAVDRKRNKTVYSVMAHHSGMSLLALVNFLCDGAVRRAFEQHSAVRAVKILLEEKMPLGVAPQQDTVDDVLPVPAVKKDYHAASPTEELWMENGRMKLFASSRGALTVCHDDILLGTLYFYWEGKRRAGITPEPCRDDTVTYRTDFYPGKAEYRFDTGKEKGTLTAFLSPEWDTALFSFTAEAPGTVTVLWRPVLGKEEDRRAHPAFYDLFLHAQEKDGLCFTNRRNGKSATLCLVGGNGRFASSGEELIGRGRDVSRPLLSFEEGVSGDPLMPVGGAQSEIGPGETVTFTLNVGIPHIGNAAAVTLSRENAGIQARAMMASRKISADLWQTGLRLAALAHDKGRAMIGTTEVRFAKPNLLLVAKNSLEPLKKYMAAADWLLTVSPEFTVTLMEDTVPDYRDEAFRHTEKFLQSLSCREQFRHIRLEKEDEYACASFACIRDEDPVLPRRTPYFAQKQLRIGENTNAPSQNERREGQWDCGYGCFVGDEYRIVRRTPVPWSHIITNRDFGTLVTESGGGYTWQGNSALHKLTPWSNDPLSDPLSEGLYLRDNEKNRFWSITRDPVDAGDEHDCYFGAGYAVYGYRGYGMEQKQTVFVHPTEAVKVIRVEAEQTRERDLSLFFFARPVLGKDEEETYRCLGAEETEGMLCVRKNSEYMFLYAPGARYCRFAEGFFGAGTAANPQGVREGDFLPVKQGHLCMGLQASFTGQTDIFIGYASSKKELRRLRELIEKEDPSLWLENVTALWKEKLERVQVHTPDEQLNVLFNRWLPYQTMACHMTARTAFFQAGGAYGFRDQLQDCLALIVREPSSVRKHLLMCASHQFTDGDVQHWWHEPFAGVRTHISDDLLFLPFVAARYASATGDCDIWEENIPYLEGHLPENRKDIYEEATPSAEKGPLWEHCLRAVEKVLERRGHHDLPLILGGDWNDGMDRLGENGTGESVWLGWFLYTVISEFLPYAERFVPEKAERLKSYAVKLAKALNTVCWDGAWYRRATDDTGTWIGSRQCPRGKIDAISQSWAVISGAGETEKARKAMESAERELWNQRDSLFRLLTPPYEPADGIGYIGQYPPGVRENGGQYTHGALWVAQAFARLGQGGKCYELLKMLSPLSHTPDRRKTEQYKLEPYVLAADVYDHPEHPGRGGWSWYTASAAWYMVVVLEDMLGIRSENGEITVSPHIPPDWEEYEVILNGETVKARIQVRNPDRKESGVSSVSRIDKDRPEIRVVM